MIEKKSKLYSLSSLWPEKAQWARWSLVSKLTAIGTLLGAVSILITVCTIILDMATPPSANVEDALGPGKNKAWRTTKGAIVFARGHQAHFTGSDVRWMNSTDDFIYTHDHALYISTDEGTSSRLLFTTKGSKRVLLADREETAIWAGLKIFFPEPSHDDRFIALGLLDERSGEIHLGVLDGRRSVFLPETQGTPAQLGSAKVRESKAWAPHKNHLAFVADFGDAQVLPVVVDFGSEKDTEVPVDRWSPDVEELIFSGVERVAWSPSGEKLAFSHGGGGVYAVTIYDAKLRKKLVEEEVYGSGMQWLASGELMFITAGEGGFELATYSQVDMTKHRVVTTSDYFRDFEVTRDGRLIAFWEDSSKTSVLWAKDLGSGVRQRVLEVPIDDEHLGNTQLRQRFLSWNRYGTKLLVAARGEIVVITHIDSLTPG